MRGTFDIKNNLCPFCKMTLEHSYTRCPHNAFIPCLECKKCHYYFYTDDDYMLLNNIANAHKRNLNQHVLIYRESILNNISKSENKKSKDTKSKKEKKIKKSKNIAKRNNKSIGSIKIERINVVKIVRESCEFYKNKYCIYSNRECNLNSILCPKNNQKVKSGFSDDISDPNNDAIEQHSTRHPVKSQSSVTTIVLNDNRKCIYNNHKIQDVCATLKIATKNNGIIDKTVNIAYCNTCDLYFMLKREYKSIKEQGVILCEVIDYTTKSKRKKSTAISSNESRIHQLGYNVVKGSNYTDAQRQAILAHIIENTDISKHEIESCITRPMKQHMNQQNYSDAVACWNKDLEFVRSYQKGDMPEVIIGKIIVGKRI